MRKSVLSALGLVSAFALVPVLAGPAGAAGTTGPFTGVVRQGDTRTHTYDNNPSNSHCIQLATDYTVTLTYAPASDVLTLSALGKTVTGTGGVATLTGTSGWCTRFTITVTGTSVASTAPYTVTVTRGSAGSLADTDVALG